MENRERWNRNKHENTVIRRMGRTERTKKTGEPSLHPSFPLPSGPHTLPAWELDVIANIHSLVILAMPFGGVELYCALLEYNGIIHVGKLVVEIKELVAIMGSSQFAN